MTPTTKLVTDMVAYVSILRLCLASLTYALSIACKHVMSTPRILISLEATRSVLRLYIGDGDGVVYILAIFPQATAIVSEKLAAAKGPPPDPNSKKAAINNNKDLDVDAKKEEPSFFGSFFAPKGGAAKKKGVAAMEAPPPSIRPQNALNERETMETEVISTSRLLGFHVAVLISMAHQTELLIHSYFNIVKREMIDMVPKAISLTLVNYSKENLQRELLQELYKPDVLDELLKESDYVVSRRKELQTMVQALNKAEEYVFLRFYFGNLKLIPFCIFRIVAGV